MPAHGHRDGRAAGTRRGGAAHALGMVATERHLLMPVPAARLRAAQWELLEALLFWASFSDGSLDERVLCLPPRAFAQAVELMDLLGWIDL